MRKFLGILFTVIFLVELVSAYYYDLSPSELIENEWVVFGGVFLIVFALVYISLVNFFTRKKKSSYPWLGDESILQNKSSIAVISLIIALFTAAAFVQQGWIERFFGEAMAAWILLITLIIVVVLTIPFYKALKKSIGTVPTLIALIVGIWAIIKFGFNPYESGVFDLLNIPHSYYEFYDFFASTTALITALIIFGIIGLIKGAMKK